MTVRFVAGAAGVFDAAAAVPALRFTTVAVLPSLDSLTPLALRAGRDAGAALPLAVVVFVATAPLLALTAGAEPLELALDEVVVLRTVAAARVDRAFSTMLLRRLVDDPVFVGDTGLAMNDLLGEPAGRSRGATRELDDVGESTWPGWPLTAAAPRSFFGLSIFSASFSLSPPAAPPLIKIG